MISTDVEQIKTLEWANYAAQKNLIAVTPSAHLAMRDDLVITSTRLFPIPEANHACLLRAADATIDVLIEESIDYFKSRRLPACVFVSPACTPQDLVERLKKRGFKKQEERESWMTIRLPGLEIPRASRRVDAKEIAKREIWPFAKVYLAAFRMPIILTPLLALLLRPTVDLPNVHYYVARVDTKPVGICLWYAYEGIGCLGGMGVLPSQRRNRAGTALTVKAVTDARAQGMHTMMLQTTNQKLERFLRISGFRTMFTRTRYIL
jgi:GNAT superfamily N-acetyltransferase